jgi:hypothetical protein
MSTLTIGSVVFGPAASRAREAVQEPRTLVSWLRLHRDHGEITDTTTGGTRVLTCECGARLTGSAAGPVRVPVRTRCNTRKGTKVESQHGPVSNR